MSAERLREAAIQARAEANVARSIAPFMVEGYQDDCGLIRAATLHDAVADWLDQVADRSVPILTVTSAVGVGPHVGGTNTPSSVTLSDFASEVADSIDPAALAVATAYLGSDS